MDESPEIIATNPALSISDIDATSTEYPIHVDKNAFDSGIRVISHEVAPSGIAYVTLGLDVSIIPYEDAVGMTTPRSYQVRTRIRGRYSVRASMRKHMVLQA